MKQCGIQKIIEKKFLAFIHGYSERFKHGFAVGAKLDYLVACSGVLADRVVYGVHQRAFSFNESKLPHKGDCEKQFSLHKILKGNRKLHICIFSQYAFFNTVLLTFRVIEADSCC